MGADIGTMPRASSTPSSSTPSHSGLSASSRTGEGEGADGGRRPGGGSTVPLYEYAARLRGAFREAVRRFGEAVSCSSCASPTSRSMLSVFAVVTAVRPALAGCAAGAAPRGRVRGRSCDGGACAGRARECPPPLDDLRERSGAPRRRGRPSGVSGSPRGQAHARELGRAACRPRAPSRSCDKLVEHRCLDFGRPSRRCRATGSSPASAAWTGASCTSSPRTSRCSGAALSETNARKICKSWNLALKMGRQWWPHDSGGGASRRRRPRRAAYADIFLRNTLASGSSPRSPRYGALRGGAVYTRPSPIQRDGEGHLVHVRDRSGRHPDGHPRRR